MFLPTTFRFPKGANIPRHPGWGSEEKRLPGHGPEKDCFVLIDMLYFE
jgi:hypothetical protein